MPPARLPADESARLRALRNSGVLDSGTDRRLDVIVARAARLFGVPIAAVTLIDVNQRSFKASIGLGVPHTSRAVAFCAHVILGEQVLVVLDAPCDPQFADNSLVLLPPHIRFYVGAPVYGPGHQPLGALCVIDTQSRPSVTPELLAALQTMAAEVSTIFAEPPGPDAPG